MFASPDVPQANTLTRILPLLRAIESGKTSGPELGKAIGIATKQVHHYKNAARLLGFLTEESQVTEKGRDYARADGLTQREMLSSGVRNVPVIRAMTQAGMPLNSESIHDFLFDNTDLKGTALDVRAGCILAWFKQTRE